MSERRLCRAAACERYAIAKGLCRLHYSRQRRGKPLTEDRTPYVRFGEYGVLAESGDRVQCHECGGWYESLGAHAVRAHDMTAREYKIAYGLPLSRGMLPTSARDRQSARATDRVGSAGWAKLEAKRDPGSASQSRTEESFASSGRHQNLETARENGRITQVVRSCVICGAQWCNLQDATRTLVCSRECHSAVTSLAGFRGGPWTSQRGQARVRQVIDGMQRGLSNREIAAEIGVTPTLVGIVQKQLQQWQDETQKDAPPTITVSGAT